MKKLLLIVICLMFVCIVSNFSLVGETTKHLSISVYNRNTTKTPDSEFEVVKLYPTMLCVAKNRFDPNGNKTGYWIERGTSIWRFMYYIDGKANGLCRFYQELNGRLSLIAIGLYNDNQEVGQWQYYCRNGMLSVIADSVSLNTRFKDDAYKMFAYPDSVRQYYGISYDQKGNRVHEGWCLYHGDMQIDFCEVGLHKYYNPDGSVIIKNITNEGYKNQFEYSRGIDPNIYEGELLNARNNISEFAKTAAIYPINQQLGLDTTMLSVAKNLFDSNGNKTGYWVEREESLIYFTYYIDGKANGIARYYREYGTTGKYYLFSVGQYQDDREIGQWQYYYPSGNISIILDSFSVNTDFLAEAKKLGYSLTDSTRQCHFVFYDTKGNRAEEGWRIYNGDIFIDGDYVGIHKYYNENGVEIK